MSSIQASYIKLQCLNNNTKYVAFHTFLPDMRRKRLKNAKNSYSVLIIGLDTMSRLNAHRQLPKTLSLLKSKFNSIEFKGYSKVGLNTLPNLIPLLTGMEMRIFRTNNSFQNLECWNKCKWSFIRKVI